MSAVSDSSAKKPGVNYKVLQTRIADLRQERERVLAEREEVQRRVEEKQVRLKSDLAVTEDAASTLEDLKMLLERSEELKRQETAYRNDCRDRIRSLQARNEKKEQQLLQSETGNIDVIESEAQLQLKLSELRKRLAEESRSVCALERRLDERPGGQELAQYRRRFLELDRQLAAEYSQTRSFYCLYNTLEAQKSILSREVSMLESILEGLPHASDSVAQKEHFLRQLEFLVKEVGSSLTAAKSALLAEEQKRTETEKLIIENMEAQRRYAMLVRDLNQELRENAVLESKLKKL